MKFIYNWLQSKKVKKEREYKEWFEKYSKCRFWDVCNEVCVKCSIFTLKNVEKENGK